jgi:hypothetical protein
VGIVFYVSKRPLWAGKQSGKGATDDKVIEIGGREFQDGSSGSGGAVRRGGGGVVRRRVKPETMYMSEWDNP